MAELEVGIDRCTTMLGVGGAESVLRVDRPVVKEGGGGDLSRGDVGQCGVLSPDSMSEFFCDGLAPFVGASLTELSI